MEEERLDKSRLDIRSEQYVYPSYLLRDSKILFNATESIRWHIKYQLDIITYVRKFHEETKLYCLIPVRLYGDSIMYDEKDFYQQSYETLINLQRQFHAEVYKCLLFYKIDIRNAFIDNYGDIRRIRIYVDKDQRPEEIRLNPDKMYNI